MSSRPAHSRLLLALATAVLAIGLAGPFVRLAEAAPLSLAFWRMSLASLSCAVLWALRSRTEGYPEDPSSAPPRLASTAALALLSGGCLAVHFFAFFSSLQHLSVTAAVVLVNLQPVFAIILASLFLAETLRRAQWAGLAIALLGAGVIALGAEDEAVPGGERALGVGFSLLGAASGAAYYVIGRYLRQRRANLWAYVTPVYGVAALGLGLAVIAEGRELLPTTLRELLCVFGLVAGPTLLGHTLLNWSLRWLPASAVNIVALGEPITAAFFAGLILAEIPALATVLGGAVVLLGLGFVLRPESQASYS